MGQFWALKMQKKFERVDFMFHSSCFNVLFFLIDLVLTLGAHFSHFMKIYFFLLYLLTMSWGISENLEVAIFLKTWVVLLVFSDIGLFLLQAVATSSNVLS